MYSSYWYYTSIENIITLYYTLYRWIVKSSNDQKIYKRQYKKEKSKFDHIILPENFLFSLVTATCVIADEQCQENQMQVHTHSNGKICSIFQVFAKAEATLYDVWRCMTKNNMTTYILKINNMRIKFVVWPKNIEENMT